MVHQGPYTLQAKSNSEICIAPRTIAIVLKQKKSETQKRYTGERLFTLFRRANSGCSWNQQLHQAIRKIVFVGHLRPHTLLVYGTSDHIEALRSAWIKNIITAPDGFNLLYFGELQSLYIDTVSATSFTPLPDALCSIILQLNRTNVPAIVSTIKTQLEKLYSHVQSPSDQVIFEALNTLMREKKVCLTDTGYFISSDNHTRPLSIVITNPTGDIYAPVVIMSPTKQKTVNTRNKKTSSPKKTRELKKIQNEDDLHTNRNVWGEEPRKTKLKDKAGALKRMFGIKPKTKKRNKSGESAGTSSGCSSAHSPPISIDDNEIDIHQPMNNQYAVDSRSTSQLTSARVPFQVTQVPANRSMNDSLMVHCGVTMMRDPNSGSDYATDEEAEVDDRVPEMYHRPIKHYRHKATTHLTKRPNGNRRHRKSSSSTTDSESYTLPTYETYFESKKHITASYRQSSTQRSSSRVKTLPPDVSSIMAVSTTLLQGSAVPHPNSPVKLENQARPGLEGESNDVAHHSTPKEESQAAFAKAKHVFNATGHSQCDDCCRDCVRTPKRTIVANSLRSRAATNNFCECEDTTACSCVTEDKPVRMFRTKLSQEASL